MEHARPPAELSLEGGPAARSEAWRTWRRLFEVFIKASGVSKEPKEVQASLLVNLIGAAGYEVFSTFKFDTGESEDDVDCVLKKFDLYFGAKPNITVRRYKFFTRSQEEGENIDQYLTALRVLAQQCAFGELNESLLRDRIVCGVNNNIVRDRLLRTDDLTLSKAIQICQAAEMSKEESQCIGNTSDNVQVNAVQSGGGSRARGAHRAGSRRGGGGLPRLADGAGAGPSRDACRTCGSGRCTGGDRCPARNMKCFICDRKGHFSRVCRQKFKAISKVLNLSVGHADSEDDDTEVMFYVDIIGEDKGLKTSKEWTEKVVCNGKRIILKIDTGSMLNVISRNQFLSLGLSITNLKPFTKRVLSFTGNRLPIIGTDNVSFAFDNNHYTLPFVVADLNCQNVLGLEGCISLKLINYVNVINIGQYDDLFKGLGQLPGEYSISVDKNVQPVVCPTRKISFGIKDKLLKELNRMETLGVVRKVTHPTDWVNAIVIVPKKDGSIRVCLDPRPLNRAVRRAHYTLPTVAELAVRLRGAAVFSVCDARCGFWMVKIDDASADLCTFSTPFGRYQFLRLPYGINCAPEVFHAKLRQHLEDLEGVESFIDDVIVWGRDKREHDERLDRLLQRTREIGMKFNREKCKFGVSEITYLGHKFDAHGMRPDDSKVKAVMEMPYPNDRKSLERFLGMVNFLSKFIQNYSGSVNVLRSLLKKDSEWLWEQQHSSAVDELKRKLASAPVLALYCEHTPIVVSVDASSVALGGVLLQGGRPVEFASLTLTDTQTRYAQIEKEMLAIVFAVERFRQYIYGRSDVTVQTDHKPLEALFNKPLVSVPARLQRMMMRVQGYDIKVVYTPGKYMYIADTLSRAPLKELMHERVSEDVDVQTCFMLENVPFSDQKMESIRKETEADGDCRTLIRYITEGWPKNRREVKAEASVFWPYHEQLHYAGGIIFKGECVFIPRSLRNSMISRVHEGHLGIERCKRRAREVMFWPGLGEDVERAVRGCATCALHAPRARRQPLLQHAVPPLPWHKLASDIFEYRKKRYIILVDYFSNYVEVGELASMSAKQIIHFMRDQFARHGIPSELVSDNGPGYSSHEFKTFMKEWEVRHVTSSPRYAQSNGKSERTVQTVKNLLKKCMDSGEDFSLALLNYRTSPRNGLDSPAQMLMGRRLNTKLPVTSKLLTERVDNERNYKALMSNRQKEKVHYDRSARSLERLSPGDKATLISDGFRKPVTVVARAAEPRSYVVEDESSGRYRRSRCQLVSRAMTAKGAGQIPRPTTVDDGKSSPIWVTGVRRRRTKTTSTEQLQPVTSQSQVLGNSVSVKSSPQNSFAQYQPEGTDTECDEAHLPDGDSGSDEYTPSSPVAVPITRSAERTARMLSNLLFGSNKEP